MHSSLRLVSWLALMSAWAGCHPAGRAPGASCTQADQCASNLCLTSSMALGATGTCVGRCSTTADCVTGQVCGTFNYGGVYPESGVVSTDPSEIVKVCRPRLNPTCAPGNACTAPGEICVGAPGVCSTPCAQDADCVSTLCVPGSTCGAEGACAPLCDDLTECPSGWYCNLVGAQTTPHGRCEPVSTMTMGTDAACPPGLDAGD